MNNYRGIRGIKHGRYGKIIISGVVKVTPLCIESQHTTPSFWFCVWGTHCDHLHKGSTPSPWALWPQLWAGGWSLRFPDCLLPGTTWRKGWSSKSAQGGVYRFEHLWTVTQFLVTHPFSVAEKPPLVRTLWTFCLKMFFYEDVLTY